MAACARCCAVLALAALLQLGLLVRMTVRWPGRRDGFQDGAVPVWRNGRVPLANRLLDYLLPISFDLAEIALCPVDGSDVACVDAGRAKEAASRAGFNATPGYDHPYAEWWARMVGVLFLSFLSGPILFGAPMESHLKQTMVAMTGILICFCSIIFGSPKDVVTFMWYPQLGLQVVLCLVNAYLIANPTKTKGKKK